MNEREFPNIQQALAASAALHLLFFFLARGVPPFGFKPEIEVDISSPFPGTGPARLAPPKAKVMDKGLPLPAQKLEKLVQTAKQLEPPKDWVTPNPEHPKVEKPPETTQAPGAVPNATESTASSGGVDGGKGISTLPGGVDGKAPYGTKDGYGDGGSQVEVFPRLLNLDELLSLLRKYYPENERRAGNEGDVLLKVHVGVDGNVRGSDVIHADAENFGAAAQKVALLMRFSPALNHGAPVPVAIKVPMKFRLKD